MSCITPVQAAYYTTRIVPSSYKNIGTPEGALVLPDGNIWYADSTNYRIVKVSPTGTILRTVGRQGSREGEFANTVKDITRDDDGNLYVLDYCHVTKLDSNGGYQKSWGSCGTGDAELFDAKGIAFSSIDQVLYVSDSLNHRIKKYDLNGTLLSQFGSHGTGDGQFDEPHGLTVDNSGNLYVVDTNNHRVQQLKSDGVFVQSWGSADSGDPGYLYFPKDVVTLTDLSVVVTSQNTQKIKIFDYNTHAVTAEWGSSGTGDSQFKYPQYLAKKSSDESLWVTDWGLKRLQHFSSAGSYLGMITNSGTSDGVFTTPYAVDFDATGNMYVLDSTGRVQKFDSNGAYLATPIAGGSFGSSTYHLAISPTTGNIFVSEETKVSIFTSSGILVGTLGNHGDNGANSGDGDFNQARGMAFDSSGNVYVADLFNNRVQKFDPTQYSQPGGGYLTKWSFYHPETVYVDGSDNVYVAAPNPEDSGDPDPQVVRRYNTSGVLQDDYLSHYGGADTEYWKIAGLWIHSGSIYLSDPNNDRIQVYAVADKDKIYTETIGSRGTGLEQFDGLRYARINPVTDDLVAVDSNNHRLELLRSGVKIINLIPSADVIATENSSSLVRNAVNPTDPGVDSLTAELYFGDYLVSDFSVNLTDNRDWASVNTIALPQESKALVVNLNPTDAPGVSSTHSIYVVKQAGQNAVRVCTDATKVADLTASCPGYTLSVGDSQLSSVTIDGRDYWKVTGLTGTGVIGQTTNASPTPTPTPTSQSTGSTTTAGTPPSDGSCHAEKPAHIPDLFQIDTTATTAKIFFTPAALDRYIVSFATDPAAEMYSVDVTLAHEGVQNYQVNLLKPRTTYYFKVRSQNGCMPGDWSQIMAVTTNASARTTVTKWYRYGGRAALPYASRRPGTRAVSTPTAPSAAPAPIVQTPTATPAPTPAPKPRCFLWFCW
jgi:streptogramin lyase